MAARRRSAGTGKGDEPKSAFKRHREETLAVSRSGKSDRLFDAVIGHIEDIIIGDAFQKLQQTFLKVHYVAFDDEEENKLIYTDIHNEYVQTVEQFLEAELRQRMPSFNMTEFQKQLVARRKHLEGEVFDILLTFTDFVAFRELILDYKAEQEGTGFNLGESLIVSQPLALCETNSTEIIPVPSETPTESKESVTNECITDDEPEPMRISLEFAKSDDDDDEEMSVTEELTHL